MMTDRFAFDIEFTPAGDVLSGPGKTHYTRAEVDALVAAARRDATALASRTSDERAALALERISAALSPVGEHVARIAAELRREAAELALAAACKIAGDALDAQGADKAARAIAAAAAQLRAGPQVHVFAAPADADAIEAHLSLRRAGASAPTFHVVADPAARPGDWRIDWEHGAAGFSREAVEAAVAEALARTLGAPVDSQPDLFAA